MTTALRRAARALAALHDGTTVTGFRAAQVCLVVIVASYCYETIARHAFAAPTWWSNEVVAYALCIGTFLALPEVTRRRGHIAITFATDALPPRAQAWLQPLLAVVAGATCLFVAWICLRANISHWDRGEMLVRVRPIPKLWLSVFLTWGFLLAGLHFLRQAAAPAPAARAAA